MKSKVVHLYLKEPVNDQHDFYFGSIKAIYDTFPKETVGIAYTSLKGRQKPYENEKCIIRVGELIRKNQSRTKINEK